MPRLVALLIALLACPFAALAAPVTLRWTPPTQNTDGTALTNLAGYRILYGPAANQLTQTVSLTNPGLTSYALDLAPGKWFFAMKAFSSAGTESDPTATVSANVAEPVPVIIGPYAYTDSGTATAPKMTSAGYLRKGAVCGSVLRSVGSVRFCQIDRDSADLVIFGQGDPTLSKGVWAKLAP